MQGRGAGAIAAAAAAAGGGEAAAAGGAGGAGAGQQQAAVAPAGGQPGPSPALYWYQRAHRALKQRASEPTQMLREYQHVLALDASIPHSCSVARSRAAVGRNRYSNVLPYDYNRVILQQQPDPPYLNASTVTYTTPSLPAPCSYIATQGPLPATTADFWAMVLQQQVPAVVMLTSCAEAGVVKCGQYFPHALGAVSREGCATIEVTKLEPFGPDCTLRTLQVTYSSSSNSSSSRGSGTQTHTLSHYHFHAWPDHGTPDNSSGVRAICRALAPARATGRPILLHCSAGIGRTGTFCAIDILLQRLDAWATCSSSSSSSSNGNGNNGTSSSSSKNSGSNGGGCSGSNGSSNGSSGGCPGASRRAEVEDTLDVPALVHKLRAQRMGMVQTIEQYVFLYKALLDDLAERIKDGSSSDGSNGGGSNGGCGGSQPAAAAAAAAAAAEAAAGLGI